MPPLWIAPLCIIHHSHQRPELDKGLDIVTSDRLLHHALAMLDEDEVFARLLGMGKGDTDTTTARRSTIWPKC